MNLDDIPRGSFCVLDAMIPLLAEQDLSAQAKRLLERIVSKDVLATMPESQWQDLADKLMTAEAVMMGHIAEARDVRRLRQEPAKVKDLAMYRDKVKALATLGLGIEPCTKTDLMDSAFKLQERYGLLTADAVLLAVAIRLKADAIVTVGTGFKGVSEVQIYLPSDVRMGA